MHRKNTDRAALNSPENLLKLGIDPDLHKIEEEQDVGDEEDKLPKPMPPMKVMLAQGGKPSSDAQSSEAPV